VNPLQFDLLLLVSLQGELLLLDSAAILINFLWILQFDTFCTATTTIYSVLLYVHHQPQVFTICTVWLQVVATSRQRQLWYGVNNGLLIYLNVLQISDVTTHITGVISSSLSDSLSVSVQIRTSLFIP
jgi:hypothetical protein